MRNIFSDLTITSEEERVLDTLFTSGCSKGKGYDDYDRMYRITGVRARSIPEYSMDELTKIHKQYLVDERILGGILKKIKGLYGHVDDLISSKNEIIRWKSAVKRTLDSVKTGAKNRSNNTRLLKKYNALDKSTLEQDDILKKVAFIEEHRKITLKVNAYKDSLETLKKN